MRSAKHTPARFLLLSLAALVFAFAPARAAEDDDYDADEYEEHARVVRISLMRGEVSLRRDGNIEWETARLNLPLVEGDTLATGRGSHVEIQIDAYNFVRVGEESVLRVATLRDEGVALSLSEGTATVRLARFEREREYFELDAPKTTVAAEKKGLYRVDAGSDGAVRVTVRDDGRARIYSESSGFVLRNNRTARLAYDIYADGDWEISSAAAFDEWDAWNDERERHLASRLRYENRERYYDADIYGAEELDAYGDWSYHNTYGWLWRPRVTVINNYYNWAPYRHGHWRWCPPYGWTWVADEPWGWAPYHYGRWVHVNNNWCWAPRGYGYKYRRAWWRPALVAFVHVSFGSGNHVAWYPLGYGQRDPRGRRFRGRLDPLRAGDIANLERRNPALLRAVTTLRDREFGVESQRARPATADLARRAVAGEPVRGRLPITPVDVERLNPAGAGGDGAAGVGRATVPARGRAGAVAGGSAQASPDSRDGLTIIRPARVAPPRNIPDRTTGAAERTPGVPLDDALRRVRVFQGREPRAAPPSSAGGAGVVGRGDERDTGVVARPVRTPRANRDERIATPETTARPERVRPDVRGDDGDDDNGNASDERYERPARPARPAEAAPRVYERPAPRESARPEPGERVRSGSDESRRAAPPRQEAPTPRQEAPPQREAPPARSEPRHAEPPPARSAPPPEQRQSPPPQQQAPARQERSAPPARSEPRERPARPPDDN